ncbi:reverse transcriptase domain-containing protein [Tanacetum coccineum]
MFKNQANNVEDNYAQPHAVLTNDGILTEIIIRLPILCIRLFTTVSKQWLRILTSPDFTLNRRQIPNLDPPARLFVSHIKHPFKCDFVSFDSRIHSRKCIVENIFALASTEAGNNLPSCIATLLGQRFHNEVKLFESCGCLLVVLRDYYVSREFTIYEMRKGCSVWSVRYLVNTDDFMNPLLEGWSICSTIWSIVLGEREEDCLVINLSGKVVEYNLISKTLHEIYDIGSNQLDDNHDDDELIMPFEADHNVYEFISYFARV